MSQGSNKKNIVKAKFFFHRKHVHPRSLSWQIREYYLESHWSLWRWDVQCRLRGKNESCLTLWKNLLVYIREILSLYATYIFHLAGHKNTISLTKVLTSLGCLAKEQPLLKLREENHAFPCTKDSGPSCFSWLYSLWLFKIQCHLVSFSHCIRECL